MVPSRSPPLTLYSLSLQCLFDKAFFTYYIVRRKWDAMNRVVIMLKFLVYLSLYHFYIESCSCPLQPSWLWCASSSWCSYHLFRTSKLCSNLQPAFVNVAHKCDSQDHPFLSQIFTIIDVMLVTDWHCYDSPMPRERSVWVQALSRKEWYVVRILGNSLVLQ